MSSYSPQLAFPSDFHLSGCLLSWELGKQAEASTALRHESEQRERKKNSTFSNAKKCASDISNNTNLKKKKRQCNISSPEKSKLYWNNSSKLRALFRSSRKRTIVVIVFNPLRRCKHWVKLCKHYHILIKILHRLWQL